MTKTRFAETDCAMTSDKRRVKIYARKALTKKWMNSDIRTTSRTKKNKSAHWSKFSRFLFTSCFMVTMRPPKVLRTCIMFSQQLPTFACLGSESLGRESLKAAITKIQVTQGIKLMLGNRQIYRRNASRDTTYQRKNYLEMVAQMLFFIKNKKRKEKKRKKIIKIYWLSQGSPEQKQQKTLMERKQKLSLNAYR